MKNTKFETTGGPRLRDRPPTQNRCFLTTGWHAKSRFAPAAAAWGLHSLSALPSRRRDVALDAAELRSKTVRTAPPDANRPALDGVGPAQNAFGLIGDGLPGS